MIQTFERFYGYLLDENEHFVGNQKMKNMVPFVLAVLTVEILLLLLGKFLWNNYLVDAVTVVNPIDSIIQLFAITILLRLLLH